MILKDFGLDLKSLRESKNITIAEISAQTRINPKFISNMEAGVFDFQPDTYIRSFLREYAKSINEDEEQIVNDYIKAKSGFYSKKRISKDQPTISIKPVETIDDISNTPSGQIKEEKSRYTSKKTAESKVPQQGLKGDEKRFGNETGEEFTNKTWVQKTLLILVIIAALIGLFYLYKSLNKSEKHSSEIKPKPFSEISEEYENKIKSKTEDVEIPKKDSISNYSNDSLMLTIKTSKEVRIKVYVDEKRIVEEVIQPKDSLKIFAKQQFRFSSSANSSVDLLLNGKLLKKPSYLNGNSIKNLVINKEGIASQ
jgi:transcriptional regulator with XRE-family HTH domain